VLSLFDRQLLFSKMIHSPVGASAPVCPLCEREVRGAADSYITSCQHEYHKKCIGSHFKGSENCPVCLVSCRPAGPQTRAKGLILEEVLIQPSAAEKAKSSKSNKEERYCRVPRLSDTRYSDNKL